MAKHIFYIPASYAALIYSLLVLAGLLLCLYVGLCKHSKELLENACGPDHYEFWPSISSAIGDFMPARQIWRIVFVLCAPFRLGATTALFSVFWQKGCRGMQDIYALLNSPRQFLTSSAFLILLMLFADLTRLISAVGWTMVTSTESFIYHNLGFGPYIVFSFLLQVVLTVMVSRNTFNLNIYESQRDAQVSYRLKRMLTFGQTVGAMGVIFFNVYHKVTCSNGTYSLATMCEWSFAVCNVLFDATAWYELKKEGWWLSGSPEFYRTLFGSVTGARPASGDVNAPLSALTKSGLVSPGAVAGGDAEDHKVEGRRRVDMMEGVGADMSGGGIGGEARGIGGPGSIAVRVRDSPVPGASGASAAAMGTAFLSASTAANAPLPAVPSATGEYFLSHDVILHRFTFCSAPSRLHLWLCDIYWSHLLFEMMVHVVEHMYFMPLIAMSLSWEIGAVLVFGAPCLLRIPAFRRWATGACPLARTLLKPSHMPAGMHYRVVPMYVLFYFLSSFSHLHLLIQNNERRKILGVAVGPLFLFLGIVSRYLYPSTASIRSSLAENNEDSRRMLYAFPLGLILGMLQRICYISLPPMFTEAFYAGVLGIALGIAFTTTIYRHAMFGNAVKENPAVMAAAVAAAAQQSSGGGVGSSSLGVTFSEGKGKDYDGEGNGDTTSGAAPLGGNTAGCVEGRARRVQFSLEGEEEAANNSIVALAMAYPAQSPYLLGFILGLLTSVSLTFYTCANYIPRLLAVEPYPASLLVVAMFAAGLYYSTDVIPICPQIMTPRQRQSMVSRLLQGAFKQSRGRLGLVLFISTSTMLFATRQTNFTYEKKHDSYPVSYSTPREDVLIKYWGVQQDFWGSKHLAFLGGLVMTFCIGALYPVVMEITLAHQRARRFALLADSVDSEQVYRREPPFLKSFEMAWLTWTIMPSVLYVLCISYPFVPMAWLVREKSHPLILSHMMALYLGVLSVVRKMRNTKSTLVPSAGTARKQRSMQRFIAILIVVVFVSTVIGRAALQPSDISYPAGKDTAIKYQDQVLALHNRMLALRVRRNAITDPLLKSHEVTYHRAVFQEAMEAMHRNVTAELSKDVDAQYGLGNLPCDIRSDIWDAASAMTFFSGMVWTVHFGLDNYNVDSFDRMVKHAQETEAGVVGLLESDSMHLTNGNRDMVEHMAYYLGYRYTDYGPTALDNTYGCALISRYPIIHVRRYVMPSPLGELACMIHAVLDVYGLHMHTYVAHFGNTEHFADGLLQSQFLGQIVASNPGPSLWLGYLVTFPGNPEKYHHYTDPTAVGKFRDTALEMYVRRPWVRLHERGGFEEEPPVTVTEHPGESVDFNVEAKLNTTYHLEAPLLKTQATLDRSFRRTPLGKDLRYFYFNETNRYATAHPRFEFVDRYCQYNLYKTGATADERPEDSNQLQPYEVDMFDWWREVDGDGVELLSDTEIQVTQLRFKKRVV